MTLRRFGSSLVLIALACTGSPVGEGGALGDAGGTGTVSYGPGPWGVLPTGYCCASDQDCRYRTCLDVGGVKMCSDPCTQSDETCNSVPNMVCDQAAGQCMPAGAPSCVPANQWAIGPRETGRCCPADFDGQTGKECQGNLCIAFGDLSNPYICTQPCEKSSECPEEYYCNLQTRFCWPYAEFYQCG